MALKYKYVALKQKHLSLDYDLGHFPFFGLVKGGGIRRVPFKGGYWELRAVKFPTYSALDTVLGLSKAFEDAELRGMVKNGEIMEGRLTKTITISKRGCCEFCGKDTSGESMDELYEELKMLSDFVAYKYVQGKKYHTDMKRFVLYTTWEKGGHDEVTIAVDAQFLENCKNASMFVQWREIQKFRSPATKAILLHLNCNNEYAKQSFTEYSFMKMLGLPNTNQKVILSSKEKRDRLIHMIRLRKKIKTAMADIKTAELIVKWEYDEENRRYSVERNTVYRDKSKRNRKRFYARQLKATTTPFYPGLIEDDNYLM